MELILEAKELVMIFTSEEQMWNTIGQNLKHYRKTQGLSREQLAEQSGVSLSYIKYIERVSKDAAHPSLGILRPLAIALKIGIEDLIITNPSTGKQIYGCKGMDGNETYSTAD